MPTVAKFYQTKSIGSNEPHDGSYQDDGKRSLVGRGSYADVFRYMDSNPSIGWVAVKRLKPVYIASSTPEEVAARIKNRVLREVEKWPTTYFEHPNVAPLVGYNIEDLVIVTPWYDGGNIIEFMKENPFTNTRQLLEGVLSGINYLHRDARLIHGDISPGNIMMRGKSPVLIDFGVSWRMDALIHEIMVTSLQNANYRYLSYERTKDTTVRPTTADDVFSFGCLALEVSLSPSGIRPMPFEWIRTVFLLEQRTAQEGLLPGSEEQRGYMQPALWALLMQCWAYRPRDRPEVRDIRAAISVI